MHSSARPAYLGSRKVLDIYKALEDLSKALEGFSKALEDFSKTLKDEWFESIT